MTATLLGETASELVRETFPACPEEIVELFAALLGAPSDVLTARAATVLRKPYGANHLITTTGDFGISFMRMNPGEATSLHYHERRREAFFVRTGRLRLLSGEHGRELEPGEIGVSVPGVAHSLANAGDVPLEVLELFSPPLLHDKVRVADRYDRALGRVEPGE